MKVKLHHVGITVLALSGLVLGWGKFSRFVRNRIARFTFLPPGVPQYSSRNIVFTQTKRGQKVPILILRAKDNKSKTVVVVSHGNACDIGSMYEYLHHLHNTQSLENVNLVSYDYPGYGLAKNEGRTTEKNAVEALDAVVKYCENVFQIRKENEIFLLGQSIGSGPTVHVASREKFAGVVLECPLASCVRVVYFGFFSPIFDSLGLDLFSNIRKISRIKSPTLLFHGTDDRIIKIKHSKALWDGIPEMHRFRRIWVENAGHNNVFNVLGFHVAARHMHELMVHSQLKRQKDEKVDDEL